MLNALANALRSRSRDYAAVQTVGAALPKLMATTLHQRIDADDTVDFDAAA